MKRLPFLPSLAVLASLAAAQAPTRPLPAAPGPLDNPLKGYAAYADEGSRQYVPSSMAYVAAPWRELEPAEGRYDFAAWERRAWETPLAKGKPVVMRVFLDYPGQPSGVPRWLIDEGVKMTKYDEFGGGQTPDYEDPRLKAGLAKLIQALGKRYDSDPRVAYIEVGFLGHWGEWHTYPHPELFASDATQKLVLSALHDAFPHKRLMARNAAYGSCKEPWLGFHDDMIPEDTLGPEDWDFLPAIRAAGLGDNWKAAPTGGEMVPGAAKKYLGDGWTTLIDAVKQGHLTWIGPYCPALVEPPDDKFKSHAEELIRMLGYEYRLTQIQSPDRVAKGAAFDYAIDGTNQGVAPFYYPWPVKLALMDAQGRVAQTWPLPDDVRSWLPGPFRLAGKLRASVPPGAYRLALGIVDPDSQKASIGFANALDRVEGYTVLAPIEVDSPSR